MYIGYGYEYDIYHYVCTLVIGLYENFELEFKWNYESLFFILSIGVSVLLVGFDNAALHVCCNTTPICGKDIPLLSFRFCFLWSGGWP